MRVRINATLNIGASREKIIETLVNLAAYSDYPATQQEIRIAAEEFAKSTPPSRQHKEKGE